MTVSQQTEQTYNTFDHEAHAVRRRVGAVDMAMRPDVQRHLMGIGVLAAAAISAIVVIVR